MLLGSARYVLITPSAKAISGCVDAFGFLSSARYLLQHTSCPCQAFHPAVDFIYGGNVEMLQTIEKILIDMHIEKRDDDRKEREGRYRNPNLQRYINE